MPLSTYPYRHDEIIISRPYNCDVDSNDWLWQGIHRNRLIGHNLRTAELRVLEVPEMEGEVTFSVIAWQERLFLIFGYADFYMIYDPETGKAERHDLPREPGVKPIAWYGCKLPNGKLLVFDRGAGQALIFDAPDAPPRIIPCPWDGDYAIGFVLSDGLVYTFLADPSRVVRFDPESEKFVDVKATPWPDSVLGRGFEHNGILYAADTSKGRLVPLDLATQQWGEPINHPDYGKVFGYIGLGFGFQGKGYYCLSTYSASSRIDRKTGKIIGPDGKPYQPGDMLPSIDGRFPRFMERYTVFDPESQTFEYLDAPEQPDGLPLLCYPWNDENRFLITGFVMPWGEPGVPQALELGPWLILQSEPAKDEPSFEYADFSWDRAAHLAKYRRSYPKTSSLYLPNAEHSPPIVNMEGSAVQYPDGKAKEVLRRASRTDKDAYWQRVCQRILPADADTATQFGLILEHTRKTIYFNPTQTLDTRDAVAVHQVHDARCGQGAAVVVALCEAAGIEARIVEIQNHVVTEAFYDGGWHYGDPLFFGNNQPSRDGRVLSLEELKADPYFTDQYSQQCFAYDPELLTSEDNFQVLGYAMGYWGSEPYYSYYLGAPKDYPPSLPIALPVQRLEDGKVKINWSPSFKMGGGNIEYELRIFEDRKCQQEILRHTSEETSFIWQVPEQNRMYFLEVRAMDGHRELQPETWYPAARSNFVLVPKEQYGWYGVL